MSETTNLKNHFLIALPGMGDPYFARSVIYIFEHSEEGACGVIINQPMEVPLGYVFAQTEITIKDEQVKQMPLLRGGPLQQERGFVLHHPCGHWRSSLMINNDLALTTSQDVLVEMAKGMGPTEVLVFLGYAAWGGGQLEEELAGSNSWLCCPADQKVLFETPFTERWEAAARLLGVDIHMLSGDEGHA